MSKIQRTKPTRETSHRIPTPAENPASPPEMKSIERTIRMTVRPPNTTMDCAAWKRTNGRLSIKKHSSPATFSDRPDCELAAGAMAVATPPACGAPQLGQNATLSATMVPHLVQCGTKTLPRIWRPCVAFAAQPNKSTGPPQAHSRKMLAVLGLVALPKLWQRADVKSGADVILRVPPRKWRNWQTRQP